MDEEERMGCDQCFGEDPEAAWAWKHEPAECLLESSHFEISIEVCPACGQAFVRIFTEFVDWEEGDDPQYWDLLPISAAEREKLKGQAGQPDLDYLMELGAERRHLKADDHGIRWAGGGLMIMPGG
ncbi:MAG: hypothetical protein FJ280_08330 [Planctomycetes bacterium]|nr:hypothetical protein [Planctomycetota bacterium]